MKTIRTWSLSLLFLASVGRASPWTVIRQDAAVSVPARAKLAVVTLDTSAIGKEGKSDVETLRGHGVEAGPSFLDAAFSRSFAASVSRDGSYTVHDDASHADYVIRPLLADLDPGFSGTAYSRPSRTVMRVQIEDKSGRVLDVIEVQSSTDSTTEVDTVEERYQRDLQRISQRVLEYLKTRSTAA
jgi:hypothetical protein